MRALETTDTATAKRSPSGVSFAQEIRLPGCDDTTAATAKRSPSGVSREQDPQPRILRCAEK